MTRTSIGASSTPFPSKSTSGPVGGGGGEGNEGGAAAAEEEAAALMAMLIATPKSR